MLKPKSPGEFHDSQDRCLPAFRQLPEHSQPFQEIEVGLGQLLWAGSIAQIGDQGGHRLQRDRIGIRFESASSVLQSGTPPDPDAASGYQIHLLEAIRCKSGLAPRAFHDPAETCLRITDGLERGNQFSPPGCQGRDVGLYGESQSPLIVSISMRRRP